MLPVLSFLPTTALFSLSSPWRCVKSWTLPIPRKPPGLDQLYGVCVCTPDCLHLQHASCPILFPEAGRCAAVHQWIILLQNYTVLRPECVRHENISASSCNLPWTESGFRPGLSTGDTHWKPWMYKTSSDLVSNIQQGLYYWYNTDTSNKKGSSFPIRKNNYTNRIVEISILIEFIYFFFYTFISIKP